MKIGDTYEIGEVDPQQFEKLAEQIGFAKPLVKQRVIDQAKKVLQYLGGIDVKHAIANEIRNFVGGHCEAVLKRFAP